MLNLTVDVRLPKLADRLCSFGLTELAIPLIAGGLTSMGVGATTAGVMASVAAPALVGAGAGALTSAVTGGKPLKGAMYGGLTGGALGGFGAAFPETAASVGLPAYDSGGFPINAGSSAGSGVATMGADGNWIPGAGGFPATSGGGALSATLGPGGAWTPGPEGFPGAGSGQPTGLAGSSASAIHGLSPTSLGLGALSALTSGARKPDYGMAPGPSTTAATQGPLFNSTFPASSDQNYINRTPTPNYQPPGGDWYRYGVAGGSMPFFQGNQLNFPGMARGGALSRAVRVKGGGAQFDTKRGDSYVSGDGGGQDDNITARLSPGEFVFDSGTVSAIGDGNNTEGAKRLTAMRKQIAKEKGFRQVVQPKLKKPPVKYLKRAS